jgi:hypothetical protein
MTELNAVELLGRKCREFKQQRVLPILILSINDLRQIEEEEEQLGKLPLA